MSDSDIDEPRQGGNGALERHSAEQVDIVLERDEDGRWIATLPLIGEYGVGSTWSAAVSDLQRSMSELRDGLRERADSLSPGLREKLELLEERLLEHV